MKKLWALFGWLLLPAVALASEGLDVPEELGTKAATENLSGLNLFFANLYNDNLWVYAAVCTVTMALLGISIAFFTDIILKAIGMEVHKIEHKE